MKPSTDTECIYMEASLKEDKLKITLKQKPNKLVATKNISTKNPDQESLNQVKTIHQQGNKIVACNLVGQNKSQLEKLATKLWIEEDIVPLFNQDPLKEFDKNKKVAIGDCVMFSVFCFLVAISNHHGSPITVTKSQGRFFGLRHSE